MEERDTLARRSRWQQHSTYIPSTRNSHNTTDVPRNDDSDEDPKIHSASGSMDHNYQAHGAPQRITRMKRASSEYSTAETGPGAMGPENVTKTKESPRMVRSTVRTTNLSPSRSLYQYSVRYRSVHNAAADDERRYEAFGLTIRLRFTDEGVVSLQRLVANMLDDSKTPPIKVATYSMSTPPINRKAPSPLTLATSRATTTLDHPSDQGSIEFAHVSPLFQRVWTDETRDFNMMMVRKNIRCGGKDMADIGPLYQWYTSAVPIDAIFPPGIPISAKEIQAYYPHHVRWKAIMLRLTENDFRGGDIMGMQITTAQMNNFQRDAVKRSIPKFKTKGYKGKSDRNLFTDDIALVQFVENRRRGLFVPTFDDLLQGLQNLPTGLDARSLTQCLEWYIQNRDAFNPKLQLNVLHTQALYRALRQPLKPFGPQNLDRNALKEWQDKGEFERTGLHFPRPQPIEAAQTDGHQESRSRLHLNLDKEEVKFEVKISLRHVLTFPFLSLQGIAGEMFKLGIRKAEAHCARQKATESQTFPELSSSARPTKNRGTCITPGTTPEATSEEDARLDAKQEEGLTEKKDIYRIPKRPRPTRNSPLPNSPSKRHRSASQSQLLGPPASLTFSGRPPLPAHMPHQRPPPSSHSRHPESSWYGPSSSSDLTRPRHLRYAQRNSRNRSYTSSSNNNAYTAYSDRDRDYENYADREFRYTGGRERYHDQYRHF
ncbi:hypothetical protein IAQ61_000709 [Plenodomus lingam]|uniref:uncharacterized protein n=1 Tax=Leptosphaeria maculans TaxID=5022 RepID=UPI00332C1991|nr:hypothetical protein IAQ61_000709 [Plenodomus lingam]